MLPLQIVFKTLPGAKISRLKLSKPLPISSQLAVCLCKLVGGSEGTPSDKIYVSCETEVKGFSKKGKQFLNFDTNLTDHIRSM